MDERSCLDILTVTVHNFHKRSIPNRVSRENVYLHGVGLWPEESSLKFKKFT